MYCIFQMDVRSFLLSHNQPFNNKRVRNFTLALDKKYTPIELQLTEISLIQNTRRFYVAYSPSGRYLSILTSSKTNKKKHYSACACLCLYLENFQHCVICTVCDETYAIMFTPRRDFNRLRCDFLENDRKR